MFVKENPSRNIYIYIYIDIDIDIYIDIYIQPCFQHILSNAEIISECFRFDEGKDEGDGVEDADEIEDDKGPTCIIKQMFLKPGISQTSSAALLFKVLKAKKAY